MTEKQAFLEVFDPNLVSHEVIENVMIDGEDVIILDSRLEEENYAI
jgi:hypothetical protein